MSPLQKGLFIALAIAGVVLILVLVVGGYILATSKGSTSSGSKPSSVSTDNQSLINTSADK
jgi:hypothetical protein